MFLTLRTLVIEPKERSSAFELKALMDVSHTLFYDNTF
jgi:hypothetical protein